MITTVDRTHTCIMSALLFVTCNLRGDIPPLLLYSVGYTDQPVIVWEGIHKGMRYQEVGSLGTIWEASYPSERKTTKSKSKKLESLVHLALGDKSPAPLGAPQGTSTWQKHN